MGSAIDFGALMRQMVRLHLARVTQSHSNSDRYRIKMVSDDYPYVQEFFDKEIFENPFMKNPIPGKEELMKNYLPGVKIDWDDMVQGVWIGVVIDGWKYLASFDIYNYLGGDFDLVFSTLAYYGIHLDSTSFDKDHFILEVKFFIRLYEAFKVGNEELVTDFMQEGFDSLHLEAHYIRAFIDSFRSEMIRVFIVKVERFQQAPKKLAERTYYDNALQVLKYYREIVIAQDEDSRKHLQKNISDFMKPLMGGYSPSDEAWYYCSIGHGKSWLSVLSRSDRADVKEALFLVEQAYQEMEKFKVRQYRPRGKNVGNASV
jgi:hypothetical protein